MTILSTSERVLTASQFHPDLLDLVLETPIVGFPVSLADAREWLRVDGTDQDTTISALIAAATSWAEGVTRRAFITRELRARYVSAPPAGVDLILALPKVTSLTAVTYDDSDGNPQTIDFANELELEPLYGRVREVVGFSWPQGVRFLDVRYTAGYGDETAVPAQIKQAILAAVSSMFEIRIDQPIGSQVSRPHDKASTMMLQDFRVREF